MYWNSLASHFASSRCKPHVEKILQILQLSGRFFDKIKHYQCDLVQRYESNPSLDLLAQLINKYGMRRKDISVVTHQGEGLYF